MPQSQQANKPLPPAWEEHCGFQLSSSYSTLPAIFYQKIEPCAVPNPQLLLLNKTLATELGLDFSQLSEQQCAQLFCGNKRPSGSEPLAQAYAGHQFGHFAMLGDGRAFLWGEHLTPDRRRVDVHLKGSGRTPYSRSGDGKAALGPMLREYLISEAMHALGVPTTRSLAVTATNTPVQRDKLFPGAILTRIASSHLRVGTFEFAAQYGGPSELSLLLDYAINRHYPELAESPHKARDFLEAVMNRHISLVVQWARIGFIHGVMNTDNISIAGETLDYGPCAFLDDYRPSAVFSAIDSRGRYAFNQQPLAAQWGMAILAQTLLPLIDPDEQQATDIALDILHQFPARYEEQWLTMLRAKIGLKTATETDKALIRELLLWMEKTHADYTNTFLSLMGQIPDGGPFKERAFQEWKIKWGKRVEQEGPEWAFDQRVNPLVIPRNHQVERALKAAQEGHMGIFEEILGVIQQPYSESRLTKSYQAPANPDERVYQTFCGT